MQLKFAEDDIQVNSNLEKFCARKNFPSFLVRKLYRFSDKKYGPRQDLKRLHLFLNKGIRVGKYSYGFEPLCKKASMIAEIGAFTSIAANVSFSYGNHPVDRVSTHPFFYLSEFGFTAQDHLEIVPKNTKIIIGHDVWIGRDVTILTGVKIGTGAIIAAGAVITKDVEPYSIVGGVPAKLIRYRLPEKDIRRISESEWWSWPDEKLKANIDIFMSPLNFLKEV